MRKKKIPAETEGGSSADAVPGLHTPVRQTGPRDGQAVDAWHPAATQQDSAWTGDGSASRTDVSQSGSRHSSVALEGHLAAADLLNPSDALDLLAHVADLEPSSHDKQSMPSRTSHTRQEPRDTNLRYPPISDGALGFADAAALIQQ